MEETFLSTIECIWGLMMSDRQTEIHTSEPLVPEKSAFEIEMVILEVKRHKSPGTAQIPAELIKTGGRKLRSEIHKHINLLE
jgi:hypothetical protein